MTKLSYKVNKVRIKLEYFFAVCSVDLTRTIIQLLAVAPREIIKKQKQQKSKKLFD